MRLDVVVPQAAPAAVAAIRGPSGQLQLDVAGRYDTDPRSAPVTADTMFDLASVTKVATAAGVLVLVGDGTIRLDDPIGAFFERLHPRLSALTVRQLLTHTAGLPSVPELHREHPEPDDLAAALKALPPERPPGTEVAYTSLGFHWLGWILRKVTGTQLDAFLTDAVLAPCGVKRAGFRPAPDLHARIAPAGWSAHRGRVLRGEVHDENAWILGGLEGHTGLFADAEDVLQLGAALLDGTWLGRARRYVFEDLTGGLRPARSAVFVLNDPQFGDVAATWSHTGYTGTSLCLVPDLDTVVVLLTNRVHPRRGNEQIVDARRTFHQDVLTQLAPATGRAS
jgi:serine-type D-Ala-D-Ala carboxypeptidase